MPEATKESSTTDETGVRAFDPFDAEAAHLDLAARVDVIEVRLTATEKGERRTTRWMSGGESERKKMIEVNADEAADLVLCLEEVSGRFPGDVSSVLRQAKEIVGAVPRRTDLADEPNAVPPGDPDAFGRYRDALGAET